MSSDDDGDYDGTSVFTDVGDFEARVRRQKAARRKKQSHRGAVRKLILGMEGFERRPRYTLFLVLFVYACMFATLFYAFDLVGYIYQRSFTEFTYSGYARRFIGLWLVVGTTFSASLVYMVGTFLSLRCCSK